MNTKDLLLKKITVDQFESVLKLHNYAGFKTIHGEPTEYYCACKKPFASTDEIRRHVAEEIARLMK